jgi:hypothetical protein
VRGGSPAPSSPKVLSLPPRGRNDRLLGTRKEFGERRGGGAGRNGIAGSAVTFAVTNNSAPARAGWRCKDRNSLIYAGERSSASGSLASQAGRRRFESGRPLSGSSVGPTSYGDRGQVTTTVACSFLRPLMRPPIPCEHRFRRDSKREAVGELLAPAPRTRLPRLQSKPEGTPGGALWKLFPRWQFRGSGVFRARRTRPRRLTAGAAGASSSTPLTPHPPGPVASRSGRDARSPRTPLK